MVNSLINLGSNNDLIPVILSGGTGTRLWPLSRQCYPKQYLKINQEKNHTLIQDTYLRLIGLENLKTPIIICNEEHRFIAAEQMREINIKPKSIILEPVGRNTAPAIAIAALSTLKEGKDPFLLVLSSDHKIDNGKKFREAINEGISFADEGRIITFGVIPNFPETGYGYIESYYELTDQYISSPIKKFIEKPSIDLAEKLIKDKRYTWNSGIFLFKASTIIQELKKYSPEIIDLCNEALNISKKDLDFLRISEEVFRKCQNISIDFAVLEKTKMGTVIGFDTGWNDIGDWKSVWKNSSKDQNGNALIGKAIIADSNNCYLRSEERLIVGIGLDNLIIVETNDAILIVEKKATQHVKKVVENLKQNKFEEVFFNKKMYRPWGSYTSIEKGSKWQVKKLEINPLASLSLQRHRHRSEHWVVVKGIAKVEINGNIKFLNENESIYVPLGQKHRLSNPGQGTLVLIEVQSGNYLGEDDIERFDDIYGRVN